MNVDDLHEAVSMDTAVIVYGATTNTGSALLNILNDCSKISDIYCITSKEIIPHYKIMTVVKRQHGDTSPPPFNRKYSRYVFVSLAPIWVAAQILKIWSEDHNEFLSLISHLVVCSSSSVETKKYSFDLKSQRLSIRLLRSELLIKTIAMQYSISINILRPAMIWGSTINQDDGNISVISTLLKRLPVVFLPQSTGLRQPIHFKDLSRLIACRIFNNAIQSDFNDKNCIETVGGNESFTVSEIFCILRDSLNRKLGFLNLPIIICIPNRLYYFLATPILLVLPDKYAAILRISSNMAGFTPVGSLTSSSHEVCFQDYIRS